MTSANCTLHNDQLSFCVSPLGAELQYLRTAAGEDLLWQGDPQFWTGRAPVLFPIVGRAPQDRVSVRGHSAPMVQHGFARRSLFTLLEHTDRMCRHVLRDSADSRAVYPVAFALEITHRLDGGTLHVSAQVTNADTEPMPFGFGFHPAFCWPLPQAQGRVHHVTLARGGSPARRLLHDGLLRRATVPGPFRDGDLALHAELFADGALVFPDGADALHYGVPSGPALHFQFDSLPDLALWQPAGAPFICIEPWHGTASYVGDGPEIAARPNAVTLLPGGTARFAYAVTVDL